ncbi:hypothetical protein BDV24DRAFT_143200 [Aspergillus arachidicola]|uniref:Secreted protein n=1 Tax=Aspergillus arachidicola TaxID=656916 RepID=A0A5N6XS27_9EURO|nr:hypothetical protein BDV24DRAFT_143200 [Aspergillus arachidicola]
MGLLFPFIFLFRISYESLSLLSEIAQNRKPRGSRRCDEGWFRRPARSPQLQTPCSDHHKFDCPLNHNNRDPSVSGRP